MATKMRFTEARVREAEVGDYADEVEAGLVLYVTPTARAWGLYKWSPAEKRPIRKSIGKWPLVSVEEARRRAKALSLKLLDGESLTKPKADYSYTLGALSDDYAKWNRSPLRALRHPEWLSDLILAGFPDWLKRDLSSLTREELRERHLQIAEKRGVVAAGRTVKALRTLFNYAETLNPPYKGANIAKSVKIKDSKPRKRYLTPDELARVWTALESPSLSEWSHAYFGLLLLTGARRSNVAGMRWVDLDLSTGTWRVPAADSKNKEPLEVILVPEAVAILEARREKITGPWVFPTTHKHSKTGHLTEPWYAWKAVLKLAEVDSAVTIHDCRRTVGVRLTSSGAPIGVVQKVLGHANPATTARSYAWATPEAARDWLERLT